MKFSDLIVEYEDALPHELCDELIDFFESSPEYSGSGSVIGGQMGDVKTSEDLLIRPERSPWESTLDQKIFDIFKVYARKYSDFYDIYFNPHVDDHRLAFTDSGYQIQKTSEDGQYIWHHDFITRVKEEDDGWGKARFATYIFYLNDYEHGEENGGRTQFFFNNDIISVNPKKGKLLMFPASSLYFHRGEQLKSGEKYIMTGWLYQGVKYGKYWS